MDDVDIDHERKKDRELLDRWLEMLERVIDDPNASSEDRMKAIEVAVELLASKARLLGHDAPQKIRLQLVRDKA